MRPWVVALEGGGISQHHTVQTDKGDEDQGRLLKKLSPRSDSLTPTSGHIPFRRLLYIR